MSFVRGPNPIWSEFSLTNGIFDDTYYAFFLTNTLPYLPQAVYQDPNGIAPWADPIRFQPNGCLPNNLYGDPGLVYRIEFRQGPNQTYPLIGNPVENYIFGNGGSSIVTDGINTASNMITNPQFSDVYFNAGGFTYVQGSGGTYTVPIGPGWNLVLTGAGTTSLTQTPLSGQAAAAASTVGNPPYYLTISNSGWTTAQLIQTFANNGAIFGQGAAAIYFEAFATNAAQPLTVSYVPNIGSATVLYSGTVNTGAFQKFQPLAVNLNPSTNSSEGTAASVNIVFALPPSGELSLTNIQLVGQSTQLSDTSLLAPLFQEQTYERTVDQEFHVYRNSLIYQPKDSIAVGWDFPFNPWQFTAKTVANVATNAYTADQTIIVQQNYVTNTTGNNVAVGQASAANNYGLEVKAVGAHNQFGILQWIDAASVKPYWGGPLSSMVQAFLTYGTASHASIYLKMRLIYTTTAPSSTSSSYPVTAWTEGGDPVFAAGVTAIVPPGDPQFQLGTTLEQFSFDNIQLPALTNGTTYLGIFVYSVGLMNITTTADFIVFDDVSLVPNQFAYPSNPKSFDDVLRECQFYYQKSYDNSVLPGTASSETGRIVADMVAFYNSGSSYWQVYPNSFGFQYQTTMRAVPAIGFYSPSAGTATDMDVNIYGNLYPTANAGASVAVLTYFTAAAISTKAADYVADSYSGGSPYTAVPFSGLTSTGLNGSQYVTSDGYFHWTANALLG